MFWKKKTRTEAQSDLIEDKDQRAAFRYVFKKTDQPVMIFKGKEVRILDISAGGLAFENKGFARYDADQVSLHLEMPNFYGEPILSARVRILYLTQTNICHSIFENCTVDGYEMIHKYVLEMQKKDLGRG